MSEIVFNCKKCGHCCEGRGGIVLSGHDIARLAKFLELEQIDALRDYTYEISGKVRLISGSDGYCIFFRRGSGCSVHPAKPDICRAWPFFRGNLNDRHSFAMAKEFCPGILPMSEFEEFTAQGIKYIMTNGLASSHAEALNIHDLINKCPG